MFRTNLVVTSLQRATDNKEFLRFNLSCKWTPISLQGEHLISTIYWIADESTLHVRIRVTDNLVVVILIPINFQTEEFANLFVTLKLSKKIGQRGQSKPGRSFEFYGQQPCGIARGVTNQSPARFRWFVWQLNPCFGLKRTRKLSNDQVLWKKLNLRTNTYSEG